MVKAPSQHGLERKFRPWRKGKSTKAKKHGSLKHQLRGQERLLGMILKKKEKQKENEEEEEGDKNNKNNDGDDVDGQQQQQEQQQIKEVQDRIQSLKEQIAEKEIKERERENAKKSHGARFLERQRLTKMERQARKLLLQHQQQQQQQQKEDKKAAAAAAAAENELFKIAMDLIYVAHYPFHNKSYRPLFRNGQRHLHQSVSRAILRQQIINDLRNNKIQRVKWISSDQYERIPKEWSVQDEISIFEYPSKSNKKNKENKTTDDRFAMTSRHETLLEKASKLESKLAKEENAKGEQEDNSDSNSSHNNTNSNDNDSSDDEKGGNVKVPVASTTAKRKLENIKEESDSQDSSSDDSSDSDDDEADPIAGYKDSISKAKATTTKNDKIATNSEKDSTEKKLNKVAGSSKGAKNDDDDNKSVSSSSSDSSDSSESTSSRSDSSDSSDHDGDDDNERTTDQPKHIPPPSSTIHTSNTNDDHEQDNAASDSEDDFFVTAKESEVDDIEVFDKVKDKPDHALPAENPARGDKSQGWATQRQRPGQFKKKRTRR